MADAIALTDILCVDVEASGLDDLSFPVEVGWSSPLDHTTFARVLIRPAAEWADYPWSSEAEELHGYSRSFLEKEGKPAFLAAKEVVTALSGKLIVTDAPAWDSRWLSTLFDLIGAPAPKVWDFLQLFERLCFQANLPANGRGAIVQQIFARYPTAVHQAGPDAQRLAYAFSLVSETV